MPARPWNTGLGWGIALIVLIVAILSLLVDINVAHLALWLIIGLAVAILAG